MVKYTGRFVVEDKASDTKYLADLVFGWDRGDSLAGWGLEGTTLPTLDSNGRIDLFDNNAPIYSFSYLYSPAVLPIGPTYSIVRCKMRIIADDNSTDDYGFYFGLSGRLDWLKTGISFTNDKNFGVKYGRWADKYRIGGQTPDSALLNAEQDYEIALILGPTECNFLVDGVSLGRVQTLIKGIGLGSDTRPLTFMLSLNKYIQIAVRHRANETSHAKCWDIKVGRLVGVSW